MRAILYKNTSDNRVLNKSITLVKEVDIELKDDNNFVSPIIKLYRFEGCEDVNYLYIEAFSRYYYINSARPLVGNIISFTCNVDVLMSNKEEIMNLTCIIDKQQSDSSEYSDKYLDDGSFVTECRTFNSIINFPQGFNDSGEFILITAGKVGV